MKNILGEEFMEISIRRISACLPSRLYAAGYAWMDWKQEQERLPADCKYQIDKSTWKCGWLCIQIVSYWSCGITWLVLSKRDNAQENKHDFERSKILFHGNLIRFTSRHFYEKLTRLIIIYMHTLCIYVYNERDIVRVIWYS